MKIDLAIENVLIYLVVFLVLAFVIYFTTPTIREAVSDIFASGSSDGSGNGETMTGNPECRDADLTIYSCEYSNSTGILNLILENTGAVELTNLGATLIYEDESVSSQVDFDETLIPGSMRSFTITNVNKEALAVTVVTNCPSVIRGEMCSRGE